MKILRAILKWIGLHRRLNIVGGILIIVFVLALRILSARSDGIESAPLEKGTIIESVYGIGTVTARRSFQVKPGVITTVTDLYVKEGDAVKKGAALVKLDESVFRSPFDGTVTYLPVKVGENAYTQSTILSLVDLKDRYVVVSFEQQGALRVKSGQKARLSFDSMRKDTYNGVVESVYSYDRNFLARIAVSDLPPNILPDMTADVAIEIDRHNDVLVIPVAALEEGRYVWRKRGHRIPLRIEVKPGIFDRASAEILSGDLQPGDVVLIKKDLKQ